jgi:hypothetical protein
MRPASTAPIGTGHAGIAIGRASREAGGRENCPNSAIRARLI